MEPESGERPNPTDPRENFADRWVADPRLSDAFHAWLTQVRLDFQLASHAPNKEAAVAALEPRFGRRLVELTESRQPSALHARVKAPIRFLNPAHRQEPSWPRSSGNTVQIRRVVVSRNGSRWKAIQSNEGILPKHCDLRFEAETDVRPPYRVFWQIVNTGADAAADKEMRGSFEEGAVTTGVLTKEENTLYRGTHSIECFIVQYGHLVAESGQFVVNID